MLHCVALCWLFLYECGFKSHSRYMYIVQKNTVLGFVLCCIFLEGSEIGLCMYVHVPWLTNFTEVLVGKVVRVDCYALYMLPDTAREMEEERGEG